MISLNNRDRFSVSHKIDKSKLETAAKVACAKLKARVEKEGMGFPLSCSSNYKYCQGENKSWVSGMYTGCFWLAYQLTGDEFFKEVALEQLKTYFARWENKIGLDDHDVGFVYNVGCVTAYRLCGIEEAKDLALKVADYYYNTSYSHDGKFIIRAHKGWKDGNITGYRTMMDSLMNAPFLCWASEAAGRPEYKNAALDHVRTTADYLIRKDGSSFHHYQFDPETSAPMYGVTLQGNSDDSCWSRGHAWGIYGFPIAYSYEKEPFIKDIHKKVAYFMLNHLPEDMIPYWDYDFTDGEEPRDSSAATISACGFLEMASMLDDTDSDKIVFESAAAQLLEAVIDNCTGDIGVDYDGLICHVTHAKPQGLGIDECAVYGDFFYLEALARYLIPGFKKYW